MRRLFAALFVAACIEAPGKLPPPDTSGVPEDTASGEHEVQDDIAIAPDLDVPAASDVSGTSDVPGTADVPSNPDAPGSTDVPSDPDAPGPSDVPNVSDGEGPAEDVADTVDGDTFVEPPEPDYVTCDASDEAWVKQVVEQLLGRKVKGLREVRVLEAMVKGSSREQVAMGLMNSPEFLDRWSLWLMDELRVNRVGDKALAECYGEPQVPTDTGGIGAFIRDNVALSDAKYTVAFNMADVVRSSLVLDDVSPVYRAHLFAMMVKPITGANVDALQLDMARRQDYGEIFEATYLHRNVVCNGCHNSQFSTTDNPDPAHDRHWPIPGLFEKALYGFSTGRPEREFYSNFRHLDLVREAGGLRPWRLASACGRFLNPLELPDDPAGVDAVFITPTGKKASVWNVEAALHTGFNNLRADGKLLVHPQTLEVEPHSAFAYLVSVRFTNQVWREVMGYPLSLVHYFPRNAEQRDLLMELTNHFVASGFSLKQLLHAIVTGPYFNEPVAADGCGSQDHPYVLPAIFNPWVLLEEDPVMTANSVGDVAHRHDARQLIGFAEKALGWPASPLYPAEGEEAFQKAVGVFVKDAEPGFDGIDFQGLLTWEARFGACSAGSAPGSCAGSCGGQAPSGCYCDAECVAAGDCCADYQPVCVEGKPAVPADDGVVEWFDSLFEAVELATAAGGTVSYGQVAAAVKDRFLAAPEISAVEAPLVAALLGAESLAAPVAGNWLLGARLLCGAALSSPHFLLGGVPAADQGLPPSLVVGESFTEHCEAMKRVIFSPKLWTITCGEDAISMVPFAPPLGGVEPGQ